MECVFVEDPYPGTWTIEVYADEIIQDSHVETPELDADYALVAAGVQTYLPIDPDQSFVTLTNTNMNGLTTCPAGDGGPYQYVQVTVKDSNGDPRSGILANQFEFTVIPAC